MAVCITVAATSMRVFVGLSIAAVLSISLGVLIRYFALLEKLTLPTITLLSPVSPVAWLPVAIFIFGIGNAPAIFMVVIALFFHMVLSTDQPDRRGEPQPDQRGAHHGCQQAAGLCAA